MGCIVGKTSPNMHFNKEVTTVKCSKDYPCKCATRKCGKCPDGSHPVKHHAFGYECEKCPIDYYSTQGKECKPCDDGTNTAGERGVPTAVVLAIMLEKSLMKLRQC